MISLIRCSLVQEAGVSYAQASGQAAALGLLSSLAASAHCPVSLSCSVEDLPWSGYGAHLPPGHYLASLLHPPRSVPCHFHKLVPELASCFVSCFL